MHSPVRFSAVRFVSGTPTEVQRAVQGLEKLGKRQGVAVQSEDSAFSGFMPDFSEKIVYTKQHADDFLYLEPQRRDYEKHREQHFEKFHTRGLSGWITSQYVNGEPATRVAKILDAPLSTLYEFLLRNAMRNMPQMPEEIVQFDERAEREAFGSLENPSKLKATDVLTRLERGEIDLNRDHFGE